ncbi:hypothetical protein IWX47DRAFT_881810 [Phyllosticta citricarpa]
MARGLARGLAFRHRVLLLLKVSTLVKCFERRPDPPWACYWHNGGHRGILANGFLLVQTCLGFVKRLLFSEIGSRYRRVAACLRRKMQHWVGQATGRRRLCCGDLL